MVVSVLVKTILVHQSRLGIDANIEKAQAALDKMEREYNKELSEYNKALNLYKTRHLEPKCNPAANELSCDHPDTSTKPRPRSIHAAKQKSSSSPMILGQSL